MNPETFKAIERMQAAREHAEKNPKPRVRPKYKQKRKRVKVEGEKPVYERKPIKAVEPVWTQRHCLRCGHEFHARDKFTRLCSDVCRRDSGSMAI